MRVPAETPALFKNDKYEDIRRGLLTCTDLLAETVGNGKPRQKKSDMP